VEASQIPLGNLDRPDSERQRELIDTLYKDYKAACDLEDAPRADRLASLISKWTKGLRDQELYERTTLEMATVKRYASLIALSVAKRMREKIPDDDLVAEVINAISDDVNEIIENK
jgi:hypothetical protein